MQLQFARLDLGKIQDVIDDRQKRVCGVFNQLQVIHLLQRQVGVQEKVGHPDNAVHRRPDFMAHVGQEIALGLIGILGGLVGLLDLKLRLLKRRHMFLLRVLHERAPNCIGKQNKADRNQSDDAGGIDDPKPKHGAA